MVYKAILPIGGYKVGEEVPDDKAKLWLKTYIKPHVELSNKESGEKKVISSVKIEEEKENKGSVEEYKQELLALQGVGKKTVKDILKVYPNREKLVKAIEEDDTIPVRDDVADIIKDHFSIKLNNWEV